MDIRTQIISNVMEILDDIDQEILERIERSLYIQLNNYEVQERCTDVVLHDMTNQGLIKKYIATKRLEGKSEKTIKRYLPEIERMVDYINKRIPDITSFDLRFYLAMYKENRKISNRTLENMRKTLSSFFTWLHDEGLIPYNPAKSLAKIKYEKIVKKPFTAIDREKIKNACTSIRDLALTEFLYATGLRVSEVSSLNIDDIDFILREGIVIGKGSKERRFYMSEVCSLYLKKYLQSRTDTNPALFVSTKAPFNRLKKEGIEVSVRKIGTLAKVENVHPHRFRRTLATDLVKKNVPIQDVAEILGHSDLRTTQVYVSLDYATIKYNYNKAII
ncbi:Tyrosine recombinase XerC [Schaedlerella arabinosiphila]|nr:Tyrosine recombinase XerC [Schaedlerella arabinosiphila]